MPLYDQHYNKIKMLPAVRAGLNPARITRSILFDANIQNISTKTNFLHKKMDIKEFARIFPERLEKIKQFTTGEEIKDILGTEAVNHFRESFQNEGFTDETLNPWKDVKRRDPASKWHGHSGDILCGSVEVIALAQQGAIIAARPLVAMQLAVAFLPGFKAIVGEAALAEIVLHMIDGDPAGENGHLAPDKIGYFSLLFLHFAKKLF